MEWMILPLKRYAQFSGRSRRKEFWLWILFTIIASVVLGIFDTILGLGGSTTAARQVATAPGSFGAGYNAGVRGGVLANVFALATIIPNISVSVRRLHDIDRSGWWILLPAVPAIALIVAIFTSIASANTSVMILSGIFGLAVLGCGILQLVWYCTAGTHGPNRFGEDPKGNLPEDLARTFE